MMIPSGTLLLLLTSVAVVGCAPAQAKPARASAQPPVVAPPPPVAARVDREAAIRRNAQRVGFLTSEYITCVLDRANHYFAGGTAPASDIADASLADCDKQYSAMANSIGEALSSQQKGDALASTSRDDARRTVISLVLQSRQKP